MTVGIQVSSISLHHIMSARCSARDVSELQTKGKVFSLVSAAEGFSKSKEFFISFTQQVFPLRV